MRLAEPVTPPRRLTVERLIVNMQNPNQGKAAALVHGGFVDGSGWAGVYNVLKEKGYKVAVVQNPTKSLAEDVAFTKWAIDSMKSEVVLVATLMAVDGRQ